LTLVKLWHTVDGLYIWEFITTLDYEWSVIQGRRPYRWTIWIHSLTRVAALLAVIVNMIGFDAASPINCQAWVTSEVLFAYIAVAGASLLIVLRTIAIWNRDKIVSLIAMCIWWTNIGFLIHSTVKLRSSWVPVANTCSVLNTDSSKYNITISLSTDVILFTAMLVGLFRLRLGAGTLGLGRLLWTQGVIWCLLATMAQLPAAVFIFLNLNPPFNLMFQTPAMVALIIAATRIYRSLTDFCSPDISQDIPKKCVVSSTLRISRGSFSLNRVELDTDSGQCLESRPNHYRLPVYASTDTKVGEKPHGLGNDDDIESGRGAES